MTSDHVFGSDELTPELLRTANFAEQDGRVDAAEVRTFLDRVASSLEIFLSQDAPTALRAEFARNAEIAQQVLDAGQTASEQLRRQAAEDARRILDETRDATERLRETMEGEIAQSRTQVETMRAQFIQDLRDLYDRIGASLYRFERAAEESHVAPIAEPSREAVEWPPAQPPVAEPAPHTAQASAPQPQAAQSGRASEPAREVPDPTPAVEATAPDSSAPTDLPEGAKPPAWQQLPPDAWAAAPAAPADAPAPAGGDPFAVHEDEPLAPGEPLVDLREFHDLGPASAEPVHDGTEVAESVGDTLGGSWLDAEDPAGTTTPPADASATSEPIEATPPSAGLSEGSWLVDSAEDVTGAEERDPGLAHDDMLAEALIAGTTLPEDEEGADAAAAEPAVVASPDAVAIRQLILDSLAAGQTRETIETYLRDQMGFVEPGALVDAAISSAGGAG